MSATTVPAKAEAKGPGLRQRLSDFADRHRSTSVLVGVSLVAAALPVIVLLPPFSGFSGQNVWMDGFTNAGVFILLALGLNVVVGLSGLLDLGYAAFFAIGAYTYAFAASPFYNNSYPFWPMLLVGAAIAALFGIMLGAPTLRLRGDYLAIVTLGFGEIVPITILNLSDYTDGPNGIGGINAPSIGGIDFPTTGNPWPYYLTMLGLIVISMILIYRLLDSRLGRSWNAIREDELAAAANGINTVTTKLLAFAIGASTAGLAGVFLAAKLQTVTPNLFRFDVSFTVLAMVVLGGHGQHLGRRRRRVHHLHDPERVPEAAQPVLRQRPRPDPERHRLPAVPVPAVRHRPGRDDAAATRGPLPESTTETRAPHRGGRRVR